MAKPEFEFWGFVGYRDFMTSPHLFELFRTDTITKLTIGAILHNRTRAQAWFCHDGNNFPTTYAAKLEDDKSIFHPRDGAGDCRELLQ